MPHSGPRQGVRALGDAHTRFEPLEARLLLVNYGFIDGPTTTTIDQAPGVYADLDGDGDKDLATTSGANTAMLKVWINNGSGGFTLKDTYNFGAALLGRFDAGIAAFDSDGDGDIDLLTNGLALWVNDGSARFNSPLTVPAGILARDVIVANANTDGRPDLAIVESTGGVAFLINGGGNAFSRGISTIADGTAKFAGAGRFAPNGTPPLGDDLVLHVPGESRVRTLLNAGTQFTFGAELTNIPVKPLAYDVDGDGLLDALWNDSSATTGTVVRWAANNGQGQFQTPQTLIAPVAGGMVSFVAFGTFDTGTTPDMLVLDQVGASKVLRVLPGSGTGVFSRQLSLTAATLTGTQEIADVSAADLTNDAKAEVILFAEPGITVRRNTAGATITSLTTNTLDEVVPGESFTLSARQIQPSVVGATRRVLFFADKNKSNTLDAADLFVGQANVTGANANVNILWGDFGAVGQLSDGSRAPTGQTKFFAVAYSDDGTINGNQALGSVRDITIELWTRVMYPEGWRNLANVNEHVPMVNDNDFPVRYRVVLRYEVGERDLMFEEGTIPPKVRWGITTTLAGQPQSFSPVRPDVGYAFEVQTSAPIGAVLARYDTFNVPGFRAGQGESFTYVTANTWVLPAMTNRTLDFVLLYNPFPTTANVELEFHSSGIQPVTLTRTVEGFRRSGAALQLEPRLLPGRDWSLIIRSDQPIVASQSAYDPQAGRAIASLAQPLDGPGVIGTGTNSLISAVPIAGAGQSLATFFNPGTAPTQVRVQGRYEGTNAPGSAVTIDLAPKQRLVQNLASLAPSNALTGTFRITAPQAVAVSTETFDRSTNDSSQLPAATFASKAWGFGDGYLNFNGLGTIFSETLTIFNPNPQAIDVTIRFLFSDQSPSTATVSVGPESSTTFRLESFPELTGRQTLNWFSTAVTATKPIIVAHTHRDQSQPGVWKTLGSPLDSVLEIPLPAAPGS